MRGNGTTVFVYDASKEPNDLGVLVMRCPLTGKNVNPFQRSVWQAIHSEFQRAATLLSEGRPFSELCVAADVAPAGCGARASRS